MAREILQTAAVLSAHNDNADIADLADQLRDKQPDILFTVARGTSDHAAEYLAYLLMRYRGIPALSVPLSLNSIYHTDWRAKNALTMAISQSGGSPDLLYSVNNLAKAGINSLALVNTLPSPLSDACDYAVDIAAGEEKSVAATKSFIASLSVGLRLFNSWLGDNNLLPALQNVPEKLQQAEKLDWSPAIEAMKGIERLYVVGRGEGLAIAKEAALKCKETCLIHAEAFSGAEVKHGPMALVNAKQVVLILAPPGKTQAGLVKTAQQFREMGATVLLAADNKVSTRDLPLIDAGHNALQGLTTIQTFYRMIEQLSLVRGIDTDSPPHLHKVTQTY